MDAENSSSDVENVAEGVEASPGTAMGADIAAASEKSKRRIKKVVRQNSKELQLNAVGPIPQHRSWKNSRRPRNGFGRGLPKKAMDFESTLDNNVIVSTAPVVFDTSTPKAMLRKPPSKALRGAGGKGVWGKPGSELLEEMEDFHDPNYDSENPANGDIEFKQIIPEADVDDVVKKSEPIILEYFENGDTREAAESFVEFVTLKRRHLICEIIIEIAFDHKPSHREMASVLISDLYGHILTEKDIALAFESLMSRLPDLCLDTPDAEQVLSNFMARCVADDCLPPIFITEHKKTNLLGPQALEVLTRADTLLSMKHGIVRLDNVWGVGGGLRPVKSLVRQMGLLLREYLSAGDLQEATRCVRALEVPHFHHELVYEAVVMALEAVSTAVEEQLCQLLASLDAAIIITPDQMDRGFLRVLEDMADIVLDVPLAYIMLDRFVEKCSKKGFITPNVLRKMPTRGRKRFVSEGDGGHIKDHTLKLRE